MTLNTGPSAPPSNPITTPQPADASGNNNATEAFISAPQEGTAPAEPGKDLIGDLGKAFTRAIETPQQTPVETPSKEAPDTAQKPAAQTPPAEKTWREEEPPKTLTKNAQESWKTFRSKAVADVEARDSRIKALESELAEAKTQLPQTQASLDQLKAQLVGAQSIIERVAIERSPIFKTKVLDQEELLRARLGKIIDGTGISAQEADVMLRGDLRSREAVLESRQMSTFRRQQVADIISKWDSVQEDREKMTARGRETLAEYINQQQQAQESARAKFLRESQEVFENQFALCKGKLEVYNHIEGNEAWNKSADTLKTVARRLYDGNVSREMVAQAAILAPAAIAYQNLLRNAYSQIEELKTQVAKLKGLQPEVRDTGADVAQPGRILSSPNGDFVKDLVNKFQQSTGLQ
jgi:hypothetical protein